MKTKDKDKDTTPATATDAELQIAVHAIVASKTNPRRGVIVVDDLLQTMPEQGQINAVTLRPLAAGDKRRAKGAEYELICGERRWIAAGKLGWSTLRARVQQLDDDAAFEQQLVENASRADIDPLDEAISLGKLHERGYAVDRIVQRTGIPADRVRGRLSVAALGPEVLEYIRSGELPYIAGELLARVPASMQVAAARDLAKVIGGHDVRVEDVTGPGTIKVAMSTDEIRAYLRGRYMMRLAVAPFDTADAQLVEGAGACGPCPKRTGAQPALFADVTDENVCTDRGCYQQKIDAARKLREAELRKSGGRIASATEAKSLIGSGGARTYVASSKHVALELETWDPAKNKHRPAAEILADAGIVVPPEQVIGVKDPTTGALLQVVPRKLLEAAAKALDKSARKSARKVERSEDDRAARAKAAAEDRRKREAAELEKTVATRVFEGVLGASVAAGKVDAIVIALLSALVDDVHDVHDELGITMPANWPSAVGALKREQRWAWLAAIALQREVGHRQLGELLASKGGGRAGGILSLLGVDVRKIREAAKAGQKAEAAAATAKGKGGKASK